MAKAGAVDKRERRKLISDKVAAFTQTISLLFPHSPRLSITGSRNQPPCIRLGECTIYIPPGSDFCQSHFHEPLRRKYFAKFPNLLSSLLSSLLFFPLFSFPSPLFFPLFSSFLSSLLSSSFLSSLLSSLLFFFLFFSLFFPLFSSFLSFLSSLLFSSFLSLLSSPLFFPLLSSFLSFLLSSSLFFSLQIFVREGEKKKRRRKKVKSKLKIIGNGNFNEIRSIIERELDDRGRKL